MSNCSITYELVLKRGGCVLALLLLLVTLGSLTSLSIRCTKHCRSCLSISVNNFECKFRLILDMPNNIIRLKLNLVAPPIYYSILYSSIDEQWPCSYSTQYHTSMPTRLHMHITVAQSDSNIYRYSDYAVLESYNWFHRFFHNNY